MPQLVRQVRVAAPLELVPPLRNANTNGTHADAQSKVRSSLATGSRDALENTPAGARLD
eukprot:COSAG04_NODE_19964_length_404_cov_0.678689_1_plen_59_part_00